MKTEIETHAELVRLQSIVKNAKGIDREDCPELSIRILSLKWVLGLKDEENQSIQLERI